MKAKKEGGFLISKIHQLSGRIFEKKLKSFRMNQFNHAQGRILFVLWQKDRIPIRELAQKTALEKSTLTSMLDRLEQRGYLKRTPSTEDRRLILIELTEKSRGLKSKYEAVSTEMNVLFYHGFSEKEIIELENYLTRIFENLLESERGEGKLLSSIT